MATTKMVLLSISSRRISKRWISGKYVPVSHQSLVAFASLRLCRTRSTLTSPRGCATRSPSGRSVVRAAGLEPAQFFRTEGFSYQLRLSPPRHVHYAPARLWSGLYLHHWCIRAFRCCPSSLYTFAPTVRSGRLARDCHVKGFPEFEQFYCLGFPKSTQTSKSLASTSFATPALATKSNT